MLVFRLYTVLCKNNNDRTPVLGPEWTRTELKLTCTKYQQFSVSSSIKDGTADDDDEGEDSLIKALKAAKQPRDRTCPPDIRHAKRDLTDLAFHPQQNMIATALIDGKFYILILFLPYCGQILITLATNKPSCRFKEKFYFQTSFRLKREANASQAWNFLHVFFSFNFKRIFCVLGFSSPFLFDFPYFQYCWLYL